MTIQQPELEYPSSPLAGDRKDTVDLVANDWNAEHDWARFREACRVAAQGIWVNPNEVRRLLTNRHGLTIEPRRYSAFWSRAARPETGFLVADGWVINEDRRAGNGGKPMRRYRMRT